MRGTRIAITLFFLADGLLLGSWAARIPAVQDQAALTNSELGLALFAMSLGALVSMPLAGWLGDRIGSRIVTIASLIGGEAGLFLASLAAGLGELAAALFVFGAGFGAINVSANAQGLALERLYGRPILSSFHAAFSAGGLAGAGLGALAAGAGIGPRQHFGALLLVLTAGSLATVDRLLPPDADDRRRAQVLVRPPRALLVLGAAAFFTLLAEGAAADWSAVYLSDSLGATAAVAALGYTGFSLAMATSRAIGDRLNQRVGPVALARGGACWLRPASRWRSSSARPLPRCWASWRWAPGSAWSCRCSSVPPARRPECPRVWASRLCRPSAGSVSWPAPAIGLAAGAVGLRNALAIVILATVMVALLSRRAGPRRREERRELVFEAHAVLSDLDGVLVDSGAEVERTWRRFAARHGLDAEYVLAESHGRRSIDLIRLVAPHLDAEEEAAITERDQITGAGGLEALPGARELVEAVPPDRFAIVTSGSRQLAVARLRAARLPVPDVLVTAEDVDEGKPNPTGYLRAAALLGVDPAHSVVLEDAPAGVEAGLDAGMTVIAVLTTTDEAALRRAHCRVPDLRALLRGTDARRRFQWL